jgi:single-strand DNA-binding protein
MGASVFFVGNVGNVELKTAQSGSEWALVSVAVNSLDRNQKEHTDWYRVSVFGKRVEHVRSYVLKGHMVEVRGDLTAQEFQKRDGSSGFSLEVVADKIRDLRRRQSDGARGGSSTQHRNGAVAAQGATSSDARPGGTTTTLADDFSLDGDEEIPF